MIEKQCPIISLSGDIYMVNKEAKIPRFAWFYASDRKSVHKNRWLEEIAEHLHEDFPFYWLILATTDKSLGLPLLPQVEEDEGKYSEEDMRKAWEAGIHFNEEGSEKFFLEATNQWNWKNFIDSLKLKPKSVVVYVENDVPLVENGYVKIRRYEY